MPSKFERINFGLDSPEGRQPMLGEGFYLRKEAQAQQDVNGWLGLNAFTTDPFLGFAVTETLKDLPEPKHTGIKPE